MFQTKVVEEIKTRVLYSVTFVPFVRKCGKNIEQPDRLQMTVWRMRIACWITKATNTHSECVTLIAFPLQQRRGTLYVHRLSFQMCDSMGEKNHFPSLQYFYLFVQ
jgi:hypothetical protein